MANVGYLIISREKEDEFLGNCDGTCEAGLNCVCIKDIGTTLSGKALSPLSECVLCLRKRVTSRFKAPMKHRTILSPYVNMEGDYPESYYLGDGAVGFNGLLGPFVRYKASDYNLEGENKITQVNIERCDSGINWLNVLFELEHENGCKEQQEWRLFYCPNEKCKAGVVTFINDQYSDGYGGTTMDVNNNKIICDKCHTEIRSVSSISSTFNFVLFFRGVYYSKCSFCGCKVEYNQKKCPQSCDTCHSKFVKNAIDSSHRCFRCNAGLNMCRRGGAQAIKVEGGETLYFCRRHKINQHLLFSSVDEVRQYLDK